MKLFVAEDVLRDYTEGMVCILARTEKEAIEKLYEKDSTAFFRLYNDEGAFEKCECPAYKTDKSVHLFENHRPDKLPKCFKVVNNPEAFTVWGGG